MNARVVAAAVVVLAITTVAVLSTFTTANQSWFLVIARGSLEEAAPAAGPLTSDGAVRGHHVSTDGSHSPSSSMTAESLVASSLTSDSSSVITPAATVAPSASNSFATTLIPSPLASFSHSASPLLPSSSITSLSASWFQPTTSSNATFVAQSPPPLLRSFNGLRRPPEDSSERTHVSSSPTPANSRNSLTTTHIAITSSSLPPILITSQLTTVSSTTPSTANTVATLSSCVGVPGLGQWRRDPAQHGAPVWREGRYTPNCTTLHCVPNCTWSVDLRIDWTTFNLCNPGEIPSKAWKPLLAPLAGRTISFVGDSTSRELHAFLGSCTGIPVRETEDAVIAVDGGAPVVLRYLPNSFVRSLLRAKVGPRNCSDPRRPGVQSMRWIYLREALSNSSVFSEYVGDFLIVGSGLWNFQRDYASNTQDNEGHERYASLDDLLHSFVSEVEALIAHVLSLPAPWLNELKRRMWWREMTSFEHSNVIHPGRTSAMIARGNAAADALWAAAGFRVLKLFQYSVFADASEPTSEALKVEVFTRDGTHLNPFVYPVLLRELLSAVVDDAGRVPPVAAERAGACPPE